MSPESTNATSEAETPAEQSKTSRFVRWHRRVLGFCLVIFALELGLFLLVLPWRPAWELNWIPAHFPDLDGIWQNGFFRGAVSGLGILNIYVALAELFNQLRALFAEEK